jgi:coenzyme F420 hydrogenase subunit beta
MALSSPDKAATSRQEIIDAAGFYLDSSHGMKHFGHDYSTYAPSVQEFRPMVQKGLRRVALVGTPCQIKALRKMEALGIVPSDSIRYTLGLFCSGNFLFDAKEKDELEKIGGFKWEDVVKVNLREHLILRLNTGEKIMIPLEKLEFMKRYACHYCPDYSAEYADISFGGLGAEEGWTTVITRSPVGRAIMADAKDKTIEIYETATDKSAKIFSKIKTASDRKKAYSQQMHDKLLEGKSA